MPKAVKLASGKYAEVGSTSTIGKHTYRVQSDGSVRRDDGKVTAKPTSIKVEVSARTMPKMTEKPVQRAKVAPIPATRPAPKPQNAVRPAGPVPSNKTKVVVNAIRPSGPISSNTPRGSKKPVDMASVYGNSSTRKVDVAEMYGSRPDKAKVVVNTVRPSGPAGMNTPRASKKPMDLGSVYGNSSTRKVDTAKMYGSRPAKK